MNTDNIEVVDKDCTSNYCTGASGGFTNVDFRFIFFFDKIFNDGKHIERLNKSEIIMTPQVTKRISDWLSKRVDDYEKTFGIIIEPVVIKPITIGNDIFVNEE